MVLIVKHMVKDYVRYVAELTPEDEDLRVLEGNSLGEIEYKVLGVTETSSAEYFNLKLTGYTKTGEPTIFLNISEGTRPLTKNNTIRILESMHSIYSPPKQVLVDCPVSKCGNSYVLKITDQCRLMRLDVGDIVRLKMERIETISREDNIQKLFFRKDATPMDFESIYYENKEYYDRFVKDYGIVGEVSLDEIGFDFRDLVIDHEHAFKTKDGNVILLSQPYSDRGQEDYAKAFAETYGLNYDFINEYSWYHRGKTKLIIFWLKGVELKKY